MPEIDPTQLAALLSAGAGSRPNTVFPSEQPAPPPIDLGTGTPAPTPSAITSPMQQAANTAPPPAAQMPKQSTMPALAGFLQQMGGQGARGYAPAPAGQPGRPISRLDAFENFVGNFLNSFATGMQQSGTGPGAFGRGMGAAIQAPYQRQMQQYQVGQQQQLQQAQAQEAAGRGAESQARAAQMGQMVTLPNGMTMPLALAEKAYPAMIGAQGKVAAAGVQKQFLSTPFGIYDTQAKKYVDGGMKGVVTVTPDMQREMNLPQEMVGKQAKLTELSSWMRGEASTITPVQGKEGPALVRKTLPPGTNVLPLGLGSPAENKIAMGKLDLAKNQFERDTFGTLFGKDIPSSLLDDNGTTIGWKAPSAPTSNIKTTGQQAQATLKVLDEAERQLAVANKSGKLGPGAGRLNEFLVGRVGADDPEFSALRTIASLGMTGTLKAHFGSRAPVQMFEHFNDLLNTGKMTYGDLTASLKSFRFVLNDYARQVRTAGQGGGAPVGGNFSPNNPFAPKK